MCILPELFLIRFVSKSGLLEAFADSARRAGTKILQFYPAGGIKRRY
jgi:hypothetical protein